MIEKDLDDILSSDKPNVKNQTYTSQKSFEQMNGLLSKVPAEVAREIIVTSIRSSFEKKIKLLSSLIIISFLLGLSLGIIPKMIEKSEDVVASQIKNKVYQLAEKRYRLTTEKKEGKTVNETEINKLDREINSNIELLSIYKENKE